ncbi:MAG TPA: diaminopimelate epimerase [Planctomycetes bacterium]|nr:diaminopimelate epimerase [Planctomycetota bacterium]HIJ70476.1 diaminopimelate epimerase [Planctomycetota bacterium]
MKFTKMHGLGNDYVYVNCFSEQIKDAASLAKRVSNRHTGIGADGLILICPADSAHVRMRIFNADGSEAEMCGNGIRCVAKYVYEHHLSARGDELSIPGQGTFENSLQIETGRGVLTLGLEIDEYDKVGRVCVNMGVPVLRASDIPVAMGCERVVDESIEVAGERFLMTCVSMGNPHAVFFCDDLNETQLCRVGPLIEHHELFPNRINAHFVKVHGPAEISMRTWERGSGITLACGTGACASVVAGALTGRCGRNVLAHLPGGDLEINWCEQDNCVYMTGPAVEVFTGDWPG